VSARPVRLTLLALVLCLAACRSTDRSGGTRLLYEGRYDQARAFHESLLVEEPENESLEHNEAGVMALLQGDVRGAHRHFREAFDDLEDLSATMGDTLSTVFVSAENRRWKGDPYERCMNAYYLGVTYWLMGDDDNAAAAFKAGVLRDADSEEGETQSDFALLWFLMGQAQRSAFHTDRGVDALERAHALRADNEWTAPDRATAGNVLLVVETGLGPLRVPVGPHGSQVTFRSRPGHVDGVRVRHGGVDLGRTAPLGDVFHQATTRGDKVIDHISGGKAVFKDAAVIGGAVVLDNSGSNTSDAIGIALIAAGLLASAQNDLRSWSSLPDDVHVLLADLPEGRQELELVGLDDGGRETATTWTIPVHVRRNRVTLAWTRALPSGPPHVLEEQP
jgi:tetratricopeptide (TPR) repeat protein